MMDKINTKITFCECYSHGVVVECGDPFEEIYVSSWYHGHRELSLLDRLKTAWEALQGDVRIECLVLGKESTDQLINELKTARVTVWGKP